MAKIKKGIPAVNEPIKTEAVKINGEDKLKLTYDDGTVAYRTL